MIVPVIAYPIARSAPVKRVQRKDDPSDGEIVVGAAPDPVAERGGGGSRQRRPRPRVMAYADDTPLSKSSMGVLLALSTLPLGG